MTDKDLTLTVGHIPTDHTVVGYVAYIKVFDGEGGDYYALRTDGLADMELLGLAVSMADDFRHQMRGGTSPVDEED